jgi:multiple sugar transport system permease protein
MSVKQAMPRLIRRDKEALSRTLVLIFIILGALIVFFPFYWALVGSLKTKNEFWAFPPTLLPQVPMWSNYAEAMTEKIPRYIFNSAFTATGIVLWQVISSCMTAYVFVRYEFRLKPLIFGMMMLLYMLPAAVTHIPGYIILANMKLLDTYTGLIISNAASIFAIFLLRQYFLQVDKGLSEAAQVDGAGDMRTLWQIMVPLSKPAIIVICLNGFIGNYNNFIWPSLITKSPEKFLVSQGLRAFFTQESAYGIKFPVMMAANVVVMLPTLVLFAFTQRWFESGIADSGSKG